MGLKTDRWTKIREQAQAYLRPDFARQIVEQAHDRKRHRRREYVVVGITATICLLTVIAANCYIANTIQEQNLARWSLAKAQLGMLRTSM